MGALTFLFPWLLAAAVAVPAIWWLLRVMPPKPRIVSFPAYFLLQDLQGERRTSAHTPWWLLVLRALILLSFIVALADPVIHLSSGIAGSGGTVLVAVDNGWASAANWDKRVSKLNELMPTIRRSARSVIILPTAPSAADGQVHALGPLDAAAAQDTIARLAPVAWPSDPAAVAEVSKDLLQKNAVSHTVFLSDGLTPDRAASAEMMKQWSNAGGLTVMTDDRVNTPVLIKRRNVKPGRMDFTITRAANHTPSQTMALRAYAEGGALLDELKFDFPVSEVNADVTWNMLPALRRKTARVALADPAMASGVFLTDAQWQQRPVGIAAGPAQKDNQSFLNEVYYLNRALENAATLSVDSPDVLLHEPLSAIIWPDSAPMGAVDRNALLEWVQKGGFLIRFAGPNLAASPDDPLLPVPLRYGQRAMEGAMTWEKPQHLGALPDGSPFLGLELPSDVTVTRQLLADPKPEVFEKTWLRLEDGTPLITGSAIGQGFVVLVHTTAGPDWSDFCYSGLYVEALKRMVALSTGIGAYKASTVLSPLLVLDGFGNLQTPAAGSVAAPVDPKADFVPGPKSPPGLYGDTKNYQVYNLGEALPPMQLVSDYPLGTDVRDYSPTGEKSHKADFFKLGLLLLLVDLISTLLLRGAVTLPTRKLAAIALAAAVLLMPQRVLAAEMEAPADLASHIYLAYMVTGDQDTDHLSFNGLSGLADVINTRTTIRIKGVEGVDPAVDDLFYYPVIYWPITEHQGALSVTAAHRVQEYLGRGGMILFDTRDQQFGDVKGETIGARKLRDLTKDIQIPALMIVPPEHILTKSFYLLDTFPGVYSGGSLWVERDPSPNYDAVTSVLIGSNDWAAAWSADQNDRARFAVTPGGEQQREIAYRFGVNLVMAALAGNYKSDQIHIPYILERLGK